jgi:maltose O-acetyltransferase
MPDVRTLLIPFLVKGNNVGLGYLFNFRLKPPVGTRPWFKVWAKRGWTFPQLVSIQFSHLYHKFSGVSLGNLADIAGARLSGPGSRLAVGDGSFVGRAEIQLLENVTIGRCVVVNDGVRILTGSHDVDSASFKAVSAPVKICDYAWICTGSTLLPGTTVFEGGVVAAGAVVTKNVEAWTVVAGNPAKPVKKRACEVLHCSPNLLRACYEAWIGNVTNSNKP